MTIVAVGGVVVSEIRTCWRADESDSKNNGVLDYIAIGCAEMWRR